MPTDAMPTDAMPTDAMPTDAMPTDAVCVVSADGVSADRVNGGPSLSERRSKARRELIDKASHTRIVDLAREWGKSELLLRDILAALTRPGRDPREDLPPPVFRRGIMRLEDLESGMELTGTVLNVVDFGVFVDIGLSDSGLVHISRLADRYVRDPHEVVGVGDTLKVWVIEVDRARRRVSLTAVPPGTERARPDARGRGGRGSGEGGAAQDSGTQASEASPRQEGRPARPPHAAPRDGDSQSGRPPRPAARSHGARPQAGQGGGGSSTGARGSENRSGKQGSRGGPPRSGQPRTWTSRGSAQSKPISKEMEEGTEPMRSFSDLFQFYEKKQPPESPP
ncbi:MAG: S1 RNA-binding domain-containing protein [Planctomycetes bacterium]|nr:S1 RNA-binding domain-containing protein [Planctomycetota bacterium]